MSRPAAEATALGGHKEDALFDIQLTGQPWTDPDGLSLLRGEVWLDGELVESFGAVLAAWNADRYRAQWREAAERVVAGASRSAFVGSYLDSMNEPYGIWFPIWREGRTVHLQPQLFTAALCGEPIELDRLYDYVGPLRRNDDLGHQFTVYDTTVDALEAYLTRLPA